MGYCSGADVLASGRSPRAQIFADSARIAFEQQIRESPENDQRHLFRGLSLAYLGRKAEAIQEGQRAVAMLPISKDALFGPYGQHQLVRIYVLVGEHDKALDLLEPLLKIPYYLSRGWLRIDPNFDPLRGNPRFQRLVAGESERGARSDSGKRTFDYIVPNRTPVRLAAGQQRTASPLRGMLALDGLDRPFRAHPHLAHGIPQQLFELRERLERGGASIAQRGGRALANAGVR